MNRLRRHASALALVLTFLLTQLAGVLHLATERHAVCEDHGELVHGDAVHAHTDGALAAAEPTEEGEHGSRPTLESVDAPGEHAHCDQLPAAQPKQRAGPDLASAIDWPAPVASALPPSARCGWRPVPLLLQAPKLSPPV